MNRINKLFSGRASDDKVASIFLTAGYPNLEATVDLILGFENNGIELIELGIPFSDPLADGPTIQFSSDIAISNGISINKIFGMVKEIRKSSQIPIVLMGYINPILRYGVQEFCEKAKEAGADGLIIPDIPPEESDFIRIPAKENNLAMIFLVAPNTGEERIRLVDSLSEGFVYCVSVTGVTGARADKEVSDSVNRFITRVKNNVKKNPIMIGFGIKSFENAVNISKNANGFIVGSALIDVIRNSYPDEKWQNDVFSFVHSLKFGKK